ncbi:MAG: hypothetical protein JRH20_17305 [Deltaproteobacteria bacterium]|nr:hypothetical protein [Deltaproteobacteria bacterium]
MDHMSRYRLGIDLGSVTVKLALIDERDKLVHKSCQAHKGRPLAALCTVLEQLVVEDDTLLRVAITGGAHALLTGANHGGDSAGDTELLPHVNEVVAAAVGVAHQAPHARTVIDLGGQLTKWILLAKNREEGGPPTVVDFATNGACAAGSGAFLEQQAGRLELSLGELGSAAADAKRGVSIAGRCSVFAKSDMIHLQQKGTPIDEMALGLCQSLARTFHSTVMNGRAATAPLALIGGGAQSPGLQRAFREELKLDASQLLLPSAPTMICALGAALAPSSRPIRLGALRAEAQRRYAARAATPTTTPESPLQPLAKHMDPDLAASASEPVVESPKPSTPQEIFLGLDVGSVSTNLVLVSIGDAGGAPTVLEGIYLPTRGRPVEALRQGLEQLKESMPPNARIIGVGATGSGRHLAARVTGADVVRNEITAQMVSAVAFVPNVDTIFEIGGQDSKFISVKNGMLADFEMNKICAAGTGSFLEEQAERLGIRIIGEFSEVARQGDTPADLGTRCTVFMDSELVRAQERGTTTENLCAGLAYSVARNYLEKLAAGRHLGEEIVFQGGTASNAAVVGAFRSLLGRSVTVHPENRISGAIGVALLAAEELARSAYETAFAGFNACEQVSMHSFECRRCENRCQVNRISVGERDLHFGDICERFSERDNATQKDNTTRPFPELFTARQQLIEEHVEASLPTESEQRLPPVGLLRGSLNAEQLPLWTAFLRHLGYRPVFAPITTTSLLKAHPAAVPSEVCLPLKAAGAQLEGLLAQGVEKVFVPSVVELPHNAGENEAYTCLYTQQLPDMLRARFGERVVPAQFSLKDGTLGLADATLALAQELDRPAEQILAALGEARKIQASFVEKRRLLGSAALLEDFPRAVVVLGKPYNAHDPCLNLNLAQILDRAGLPAIPWDMLPLEQVELDPRWDSVPWHFSRDQLRATELIRHHPRLFPVMISSFGCGPDGFVVKHLEEMMSDVPRLFLEFDEHRGEAGLVTRVEAFRDEIDTYLRHRRPRRVLTTPGLRSLPQGRRFFVPNFAEHAQVFAGMLRGEGYEVEMLPKVNEQVIRMGEEVSTGRECHPYTIVAGDLANLVRTRKLTEDDVFFSVSSNTPCLIRQYGDSLRLVAKRLGSKLEVWDGGGMDMHRIFGTRGMMRLYEGLLAVDVLVSWAYRLRPYLDDKSLAASWLQEATEAVGRACEARERLSSLVDEFTTSLWHAPRTGNPGDRPVVGVTGDFYTRVNSAGNANLFDRLEEMGCEVWASPAFASMVELSSEIDGPRFFREGRLRLAFDAGFNWAVTSSVRALMRRRLRPEVRELALELTPGQLTDLAEPYLGPRTNFLVTQSVAKIVDFLDRGAAGALNVAGHNCMVGSSVDAIIPALRKAHDDAPVLTLLYGATEGPAQRIRLETFVHQVHQRAETQRAEIRSQAS